MKFFILLGLFFLILSFKKEESIPLKIKTRIVNDTTEHTIFYNIKDTPLIINRIFIDSVFSLEKFFIKKELFFSNKIYWRKKDSSYSNFEIGTIFKNNIPSYESTQFYFINKENLKEIKYRNFIIDENTNIDIGYYNNGNIAGCTLYNDNNRIYGINFDSTNKFYWYGKYNNIKDSETTTVLGIEDGIWYKCNFEDKIIDSILYKYPNQTSHFKN